MQTEADRRPYGAIFIDAFSGDGIPTHLLTREALDIYLERLTEDGLLVFHISNRYYDLREVLATAAETLQLSAASLRADGSETEEPLYDPATTVAMSRDRDRLKPLLESGWEDLTHTASPSPLWTDDYVDILAAMRARQSAPSPESSP